MHATIRRTLPLALSLACLSATFASGQQLYHVVDHWKIGGVGGWDYLLADPANHVLYVTHGTRVEVLDTKTGKPVAAITGFKGTHGVALDPEGKFGYISDGGSNEVAVFDRKTFAVTARIATGTNPDGIAYEPVTKTVWAFNGRSKSATVIDTATKTVVATIDLPGKPEFPQADGKGRVFDNIEDKNEIVVLDAKARTLSATWPLQGCESPSGLAIDREHHHLFPVCDGKTMAIVDSESGKQIAKATIGDGPDAADFDVKHQLAFSSNGEDGTVSVIDTANGYKTIETIKTQSGGRTMAYDSSSDRLYVVTADYGPAPAASSANPRPRPAILKDSFQVVVLGRN